VLVQNDRRVTNVEMFYFATFSAAKIVACTLRGSWMEEESETWMETYWWEDGSTATETCPSAT